MLIYLQGATEPYVPDSDAYFSLSGSALSRQRKWHGTKVTNFKKMTLDLRWMSCSEHHADDASGTEGTDGARLEQRGTFQSLYVQFVGILFLFFSKVLQSRRGRKD